MMLIKLFLFFLVLLILPDMYIYKAYIRRVSQKWTHWQAIRWRRMFYHQEIKAPRN